MREINLYKSLPFGQHLIGGDFFMKSPLFKDNVEDKEIKFLLPEDKDIVVKSFKNFCRGKEEKFRPR